MLKTECPRCRTWIYSPLLTDLEETKCPSCAALVPIKEVYVTAGAYSIYRDVLLRNKYKYQKLLKEAEKELEEIRKAGKGALPYEESAKNVRLFIENLKEMLNGSRNKLRVPGSGANLEYTVDKETFPGKLINISTTGVCIDAEKGSDVLQKGLGLEIRFTGKEVAEPFSVEGEVVWAGKGTMAGIRFVNIDVSKQENINDYILEKSLKK